MKRSLKRNLLASWTTHAVTLLTGVFLMPFVLGAVGNEAYGTWIFLNSCTGYCGLLYLGFGETICRYVATYYTRRDWERLNQVVSIVFVAYVALGSVVLAIAGLAAWAAPHSRDWGSHTVAEIRLVIVLLGVNFFASMVGSVFGGVLMGAQRFDLERGMGTAAAIARLSLTLVFLRAEWGLVWLAVISCAVTLLEVLGHLVLAFRQVPTLSVHWRHFNRPMLRECFSFSSYAFLDLVAMQLLRVTDTVLIGVVLGPAATVTYFIALRLCQFIGQPIQHIGRVFMPRAGELHANAERARLHELVSKGIGLSFLLTMGFFIGAGFFGRALVATWVGPGYDESHILLLVLLGSQIVSVPAAVLRSVLFGMGQVRVPALIYLGEALANVALSLVLIRPFGLLGVALGTAVPVMVLELGMLLPFALRTLGFSLDGLFRNALGPQLAPLTALLGYSVVIAAVSPFATGWPALVAISAGGGGTLAAVWYGQELWMKRSRTAGVVHR
jgi:O-antigen/teichoic acid export membrane protein